MSIYNFSHKYYLTVGICYEEGDLFYALLNNLTLASGNISFFFLDSGSSLNHFLTHWLVLLIYFFKKTFNLCAYACFVFICNINMQVSLEARRGYLISWIEL